MNDIIAIVLANVIAGALYLLFTLWLKAKSPYLWLGLFIMFFPQIEAINSPAERMWPLLGIVLGIIGVIMIMRVTIGAARHGQERG